MTTPLQAAGVLAALAEEGLALAAAGRVDEMEAQDAAWDAAVAVLRATGALPPDVAAIVARAAQQQGESIAILAAARAEAAAELGRLRQTRRGAQGYAGAGLPSAGAALSATA